MTRLGIAARRDALPPDVKNVGFLSFGHWQAVPGSQVRTAQDALLQSIELAVEVEKLGLDGAYVRVHHFARQLATPFPLLAAIAARTSRIETGTGVIDMRYENPFAMAEQAAAADLISAGRLQLGVSRGSPENAQRGYESFGFVPPEGTTDADMARAHNELFLAAIDGAGVALSDPKMTGQQVPLAIQPQSPGLRERIWWGSGTRATAEWTAKQQMNLMSSTLLTEDTGVAFDQLQAEQIARFREAWAEEGWEREPRVSVSRSIIALLDDTDRAYFGERSDADQVGMIDGFVSRFGRSYVGQPAALAEELAADAAVRDADTLLITVPNMLGVAYNAEHLAALTEEVLPAIGWAPRL